MTHSAENDAPQRVTIYPREAAALDRLLDAYIATDDEETDPGLPELIRLKGRIERLRHDHSAYVTPPGSTNPTTQGEPE